MIERLHGVLGLAPVADAFAGVVHSDIINMENYGTLTFYVIKGVGATGVSRLTVYSNSANSSSATTVTAIPFRYRLISSSANDTWSSLATATASGILTTAGSKQIYAIEVNADELEDGDNWVYLSASETTDGAVVGAIMALLDNPRYANGTDKTAIS